MTVGSTVSPTRATIVLASHAHARVTLAQLICLCGHLTVLCKFVALSDLRIRVFSEDWVLKVSGLHDSVWEVMFTYCNYDRDQRGKKGQRQGPRDICAFSGWKLCFVGMEFLGFLESYKLHYEKFFKERKKKIPLESKVPNVCCVFVIEQKHRSLSEHSIFPSAEAKFLVKRIAALDFAPLPSP